MTTRSKIEILENQLAELQEIHQSTLQDFTKVYDRAEALQNKINDLQATQITEERAKELNSMLIVLEHLLEPITDSCGRVPSTPPFTVSDKLSTAIFFQMSHVRRVIETVTAGC